MSDRKQSAEHLSRLLSECPLPGIYRHYKGGLYYVTGAAICEATLEPMVVYQSHENSLVWVRPLREWLEMIDRYHPRYSKV
jgi:hypothetical protein